MLRYSYKIMSITKYLVKLKSLNFLKKISLTLSLKLISLTKYISLILNSLTRLSIKALKTSLRSRN
jgi:hypothetical protein